MTMTDKPLIIAGKNYASRLIVGTGKYKSMEAMEQALMASGADMVTVAIRRVNLNDREAVDGFGTHPQRDGDPSEHRRLLQHRGRSAGGPLGPGSVGHPAH
jgi:thiazole synthase ThiGH ThiG subunit